ncbi:EmrB/QacA subfamily drug resistance transporter [Rhodopseudomonas julia]|uniref:EmrB/QacA subfamily drug resistance transporter n=1 Tax=Rhodopseudomonas julia TaxID=200617 RepID=A0ABU0C9C1_9BRAD|nr:MFS transporter [Rhodopseudomonas julia]MDQ0326496.1 EmrB/QacA subfamily drug resistance transporter [Rhodopseudomonas julia]
MPAHRLIPLIIAVALFMENMDATMISTSLPQIAADIGTTPIALKLALTVYLLSLAIFIPVSGWAADRFGARRVFTSAIVVFMIGSLACAASNSLMNFVGARFLQGLGGAMMTPVGRLVIMRTVEKRDFVNAMAWFSIPALLGPISGPPLGGFITTYFSWHWIFLINIPIGILGIFFALRFVPELKSEETRPLDALGVVLMGLASSGLVFGFSVASLGVLPAFAWQAMIVIGGASALAYLRHARRVAYPVVDLSLIRVPSFGLSLGGATLFRIGVGAMPFLLPLMLQMGFGLSPFHSGLITFTGAAGALFMKFLAQPILRRLGFRVVLVANTLIGAGFLGVIGFFTEETPALVMMGLLLAGGFARSLQFTSLNALAFADIDHERMSHATSLWATAQQISLATGVAVGGTLLEISMLSHGGGIAVGDFHFAFYGVALVSALSMLFFLRLPDDAGSEMSGHLASPAAGSGGGLSKL